MSMSEFRPEQLWAGDIIKACLPQGYRFFYELELTDLHDVDGFRAKFCKPDIALTSQHRKVAIRLNGGYHNKKSQKMKDANQRIILEGNGWDVVDFNYEEMPNLWTSNRSDKKIRNLATAEVLTRIEFLW